MEGFTLSQAPWDFTLMSIRATIQDETAGLQEYIKKMALSDYQVNDSGSMEEEPKGLSWTDEPLHGRYHSLTEDVAAITSWSILVCHSDIPIAGKSWTERQHRGTDHGCTGIDPKHKIYRDNTRQDPRCRLCKEAPETVQHNTAVRCWQAKHAWNTTTG